MDESQCYGAACRTAHLRDGKKIEAPSKVTTQSRHFTVHTIVAKTSLRQDDKYVSLAEDTLHDPWRISKESKERYYAPIHIFDMHTHTHMRRDLADVVD